MVSVALGDYDLKYAKFQSIFSLFNSGSRRCFVKRSAVSNFRAEPLFKTKYSLGNKPLMPYGKVNCAIRLNNKIIKHDIIVVTDESLFVPMLIGRDFFDKANIELVSVKHRLSNKKLKSFQNSKNKINNDLMNKLETLGILGSSCSLACRSKSPSDMENSVSLTPSDITKPSENIIDCFNSLCAIDTALDTDDTI